MRTTSGKLELKGGEETEREGKKKKGKRKENWTREEGGRKNREDLERNTKKEFEEGKLGPNLSSITKVDDNFSFSFVIKLFTFSS